MKIFEVPQKTLLLWQIRGFVIGLLLFALCAFLAISRTFLLLATIIIISFVAVFDFWYLPRFFKSCKIRYVNQSVVIDYGVFIKNTHILPFSKLIHTQTVTTPLASAFSLMAVGLKAARSRIYIPEMTSEDALLLVSYLTGESDG
jgi:membrane protein YdbS with pleckstrin-like domain